MFERREKWSLGSCIARLYIWQPKNPDNRTRIPECVRLHFVPCQRVLMIHELGATDPQCLKLLQMHPRECSQIMMQNMYV
jgi:hypothetical protein